ncbi:response regulator transcription factor [Actinomadura sp. DC4]|nr:response regulator transcription factor [Actinomadura sp. DC4]MDN3353359.1 response regulator transcription factor [Actinomadura sp. DC4]
MSEIRILLVDDRAITRHGLTATLRNIPDLAVVGEAADIAGAVRQTGILGPDVILVDGMAERAEPIELMKALTRSLGSSVPAVLILADAPEERFYQAQNEGARGLLLKQSSTDHLCTAIRMVAAGYSLFLASAFPPSAPERNAPMSPAKAPADRLSELTPREFDVLQKVVQGYTNAEISRKLSLSEGTVKSHIQHMLTKLNLRNRVHAVIYAFEIGLAPAAAPRPFPEAGPSPRADARRSARPGLEVRPESAAQGEPAEVPRAEPRPLLPPARPARPSVRAAQRSGPQLPRESRHPQGDNARYCAIDA